MEEVMAQISESLRRRTLAQAAATDAGNRSMLKAGRRVWNAEDYNAATNTLNSLWTDEDELRASQQAFLHAKELAEGGAE